MNKKFAAVLSAILAIVSVFALALSTNAAATPKDDAGVHIEGYSMSDPSGLAYSRFVGFSSDDPSAVEVYNYIPPTFAAGYYEGRVYGYLYNETDEGLDTRFYVMDAKTHTVEFPGATANGEFVYGMAYNYQNDTMYAFCDEDHTYIATVDLETGELTRGATIQYEGMSYLMTFAIDGEGNGYALTMSAALGAELFRIDLETGACTSVGNTGVRLYYAQSMAYDHSSGCIYWAQSFDMNNNGLYRVDPATAETTFVGKIGAEGMELTAMYITETVEEPEPTPAPTTPPELIPGDADMDGEVTATDAMLILRHVLNIGSLEGDALLVADFDGDGSVTMNDALTVLRYAMGIIETL